MISIIKEEDENSYCREVLPLHQSGRLQNDREKGGRDAAEGTIINYMPPKKAKVYYY